MFQLALVLLVGNGCVHSDSALVRNIAAPLQLVDSTPAFEFAALRFPADERCFVLVIATADNELIQIIGPFQDARLNVIDETDVDEALVVVAYVQGRGTGVVYRRQRYLHVKRDQVRNVLDIPHSGYITGWGGIDDAFFEVVADYDPATRMIDAYLAATINDEALQKRRWTYEWSDARQSYHALTSPNDDTLDQVVDRLFQRMDVP